MRIVKKVLKITGITLLVLILMAFTIPVVFKKQITTLVKREINKSIDAKVDFNDVSLSLFRHFPKVSIAIEDLSVVGIKRFATDTLLYTKKADLSANLISVLKGKDIKIFGLFLESPRIHALVDKDGNANWDIAKTDSTANVENVSDTAASVFKMSLTKYQINNGYILYKDESTDTYAELVDINHSGTGDFTQDIFTLNTTTNAGSATFTQAAIPWLVNAKTDMASAIKIDNTTNTYSFTTDDILLNNLKLAVDGFIQLVNDSTYNMDIKFKSPSNDFKDILSLVPGVYKKDFEQIKTSGEAAVNGFVKGTYSPQQMPAYDMKLEVRNGSLQYPDLPKPLKNIQLDLHASNVDGMPDNMIVDISKGHLEMDNEPFDFRFLYRNPETVSFIDAAAKGKIDLSQLKQFIKLDAGTQLAGMLWADVFARGNMKDLQTQQGNFNAGGFFEIKHLQYSSKDFPQPVKNGNIKAELINSGGIADNTSVHISSGHLEIGNDPLDFTLKLSNPVTDMNFDGTAKGKFTLDNIKQFVELEPGTTIAGLLNADVQFKGNKTMIDKGDYDQVQLSGTANASKVKYVSPTYPGGISITNTSATFNSNYAAITNFAGNYMKSNFSGNGSLENIMGYMLKGQVLKGVINAEVDKMDMNDWIGTSPDAAPATTSSPTAATPFLVPGKMDIKLNAKAGKVTYDKVDYSNISGTLQVANETVKLHDVKADALDGNIIFNGTYSTLTTKSNPEIAMSYAIRDMDVQKAFLSFNTIQSLMPIGKFLSGKLSSELSMTGNLGGDMMPHLNTLSGKGNLLLIEGVLKKFTPLEKLAAALQIDRLKSISVKDIKNYMEFANGKVLVKPFTIKVDDIEMQVGGMHGFDQSLDYIIAMKVPRKYLGKEGNSLVNGLVTQAAGKGIPVKLGEMVDLNVKMTGSMTNPTLKIDLQKVAGDAASELKEQAKDFAQQKIDSAKTRVKDTLTVIKDKMKEEAKDKLKEQLFGKDTSKVTTADTVKSKTGAVIKDRLKGLFNKPKKNASDTSKR